MCTASIQDFGARCNGSPVPEFEHEAEPLGPVPNGGWCPTGRNFCGYDIDVWRYALARCRCWLLWEQDYVACRREQLAMHRLCLCLEAYHAVPRVCRSRQRDIVTCVCSQVAERMGLVENRDFERVCLGEGGFSYMIEALAGANTSITACDIGVSSITASTEREERGIRFSRASHRSSLAILVHAPLKRRGMWAFFEPLHFYVWMALLGTIFVTPFFVFFFEAVFSKWCVATQLLHG